MPSGRKGNRNRRRVTSRSWSLEISYNCVIAESEYPIVHASLLAATVDAHTPNFYNDDERIMTMMGMIVP